MVLKPYLPVAESIQISDHKQQKEDAVKASEIYSVSQSKQPTINSFMVDCSERKESDSKQNLETGTIREQENEDISARVISSFKEQLPAITNTKEKNSNNSPEVNKKLVF